MVNFNTKLLSNIVFKPNKKKQLMRVERVCQEQLPMGGVAQLVQR